jgi:hypothetical protein
VSQDQALAARWMEEINFRFGVIHSCLLSLPFILLMIDNILIMNYFLLLKLGKRDGAADKASTSFPTLPKELLAVNLAFMTHRWAV